MEWLKYGTTLLKVSYKKTMDAGEIEDALKNHTESQKYFKGVFPADKIPWHETKDKNQTKCFVINLDKSTEPGSHWVCIILNRPNNQANIYFDSYGMSPFHKSFEKFMDHCYIYNNNQLQYNLSTACGQWCLYIIHHILIQNLPLEFLTLRFNHEDKLQNDYICNHLVKQIYKINTEVVCKDFLQESLFASTEIPINKKGGSKTYCQTCQPLSYILYHQKKETIAV